MMDTRIAVKKALSAHMPIRHDLQQQVLCERQGMYRDVAVRCSSTQQTINLCAIYAIVL